MYNKCSVLEFPEDIITDILSRLPVRSLLRFRSCSKPWLALISDATFIRKHLNRERNHPEKDKLFHISDTQDFYTFDLHILFLVASPLIFPPEQKLDQCSKIWGSCDGLLLLSSFDRCSSFLVNPSTRQSRILPPMPFQIPYIEWPIGYTLGFDSLTSSYKILKISRLESVYGSFEYMAFLYNVSTSSWRWVENCPDCFSPFSSKGVYLNGSLHWLKGDYKKSTGVISFNLGDESFSPVLFPGSVSDICDMRGLNVLGDRLCGIVLYYDRIVVWVMKEYGVGDSWSKYTKQYEGDFDIRFLCALRTGNVVMTDGEKLASFNPESGEFEELEVQGFPARRLFALKPQITTCVQSLVQL